MNFSFFREPEQLEELPGLSGNLLEDTTQIVTNWQDSVVTNLPVSQTDPVRKAPYVQIGLVTLEENVELPPLLTDASQTKLIQHICLPRNPRIADNELFTLDGMDYIIVLTSADRRISKDMVRWLQRLKQLRIPMLVLLPWEIQKKREQHQVDLFSQRVGVPFINVSNEDSDVAREQFILTTLQHMPAMSLALAAQSPSFRDPLLNNLLSQATEDSLAADSTEDIHNQLVRQMCAAFGFTERDFDQHKISMDTLIKTTCQVAQQLVGLLPIRKEARRSRLCNAVSTFLVGQATSSYLSGVSPSLRKVLIPGIWRLYRASGQSIST